MSLRTGSPKLFALSYVIGWSCVQVPSESRRASSSAFSGRLPASSSRTLSRTCDMALFSRIRSLRSRCHAFKIRFSTVSQRRAIDTHLTITGTSNYTDFNVSCRPLSYRLPCGCQGSPSDGGSFFKPLAIRQTIPLILSTSSCQSCYSVNSIPLSCHALAALASSKPGPACGVKVSVSFPRS